MRTESDWWAEPTLLGQAPDFGRGQFEAVAGGVAEVEAAAAAGPVDYFFDGHAMLSEPLLPGGKVGLANAKSDVAGAETAVRRELVIRFTANKRIKEQEHLVAAVEKDVPAFLEVFEFQAEDFAIELLGSRQVIDIEARFEDAIELHKETWGPRRPPTSPKRQRGKSMGFCATS